MGTMRRWIPVLTLALFVSGLLSPSSSHAAAPPILAWDAVIYGQAEAELRWPVDLASAREGELVVADAYNPRLVVFREATDGSWNSERVVPLPEPPASLTAEKGRYLLSLRSSGGLFVVSRETWTLERSPLPAGTLVGALDAGDGSGTYLVDRSSGAVLRLTPDGKVAERFDVKGTPAAIAAGPSNQLFALDAVKASIFPFGPRSELLGVRTVRSEPGRPAWPVDMAVSAQGELYVLDRHRSEVVLLDGTGQVVGTGSREGLEPGLLYYPSAIALLPDGRIAIADQGNGRAQIFHRIGADGP